MPTVTANGTDLYYERSGTGPRLLFCLGSRSTIAGSRQLIDLLTPRFDLLVHDYRGMGGSGTVDGPYAMATCAADALSVMDTVGWPTARVVGLSFGGMVAQELAVSEPSRVERLALLCTSAGGPGGSSYPLDELAELPDDSRAAVFVRLIDTRFDEAWLEGHPGDRRLIEFLAKDRGRSDRTPGTGVDGEAEQLRARSQHDVWDRLPAISCPTLVASGRYDGIAPAENGAAIASRIEHAESRVYEGGHAFIGQDPAALPEIIRFLAEPSAPSAPSGQVAPSGQATPEGPGR
jgi:pimeloyl-ACP methyl ester carboxylesterase